MKSLYKTYIEIWTAKVKSLTDDPALLSDENREGLKKRIHDLQEQVNLLTTILASEQEPAKKLTQELISRHKQTMSDYRNRIKVSDPIRHEISVFTKKIESDPMGQEYHLPTQVRAGGLLGLKTLEIPTGHVFNPAISITKNAEDSSKKWMALKNHIQKTYLPDTYSLAVCSDVAYVFSQEFQVDI